jgi:hypothetical protein
MAAPPPPLLAIGTLVGLTATCQNRSNSPSADNRVPFGLTAARPSQHSANNRIPLGLTVAGRSDPPSTSNQIPCRLTAAWRPRPPSTSNRIPLGLTAVWHRVAGHRPAALEIGTIVGLTATRSLLLASSLCPPSASNRISAGLTAAWRPHPPLC